MLSLERLVIEGFGPYRDREELVFSQDEGVYIVYGDNGRGKTTLHNAFRYALYGEVLGRHKVQPVGEMVNSDARREAGYGAFEVTLDFRHKGTHYRVTRHYDDRRQPSKRLLLERDAVPLSQDDSKKALQAIAPQSVSQFFLFDGELLRRYEDLLDPDSEEGTALEESIERVLGIPIVANARADLTEVQRVVEKQLAAQYAAHDSTRRRAQALKEAQDIRARLQGDHDDIEAELSRARQRLGEVEEELREQRKAERLLGSLDQLRSNLSELERREREATEALTELSGDLWKVVLAVSAADRLSEVEAELAIAETDLRNVAAAARDLDHIREAPDCPVCHRDVPAALRQNLTTELEAAASNAHHEATTVRLNQARERRATLQKLTQSDARLVTDRDSALRRIRLDRQAAESDIESIEQQLSQLGEENQIRALTNERNHLQEKIARDKERLRASAAKLDEQEQQIDSLTRQLRRQPVRVDHTVELKSDLTQSLIALFGESIDAYRANLRRQVEQRASAIFGRLTVEPDYVGLRITDRYGLEIIDSDGEVVRRSAGYEHLVALSLIAALQDSAAIRGPVIMDYPFGRLDTDNTARVVAGLPRMARQVVLLSFDGEFDRRTALQKLGGDLVAEYELERVTSKHTRIRPRETF